MLQGEVSRAAKFLVSVGGVSAFGQQSAELFSTTLDELVIGPQMPPTLAVGKCHE